MTEEEIRELAEECGGENINGDLFYMYIGNLSMFADYVALAEREECALVAERYEDKMLSMPIKNEILKRGKDE